VERRGSYDIDDGGSRWRVTASLVGGGVLRCTHREQALPGAMVASSA
jgi:hypothetical protein